MERVQTPPSPVDLAVRIEFCHAALQHLAVLHGVDLLHIKGVAFTPEWRSRGGGSDADVLVRPSHVARFISALEGGCWERRSRFHTGSPFGHAQTYWHPHLGYADVHRFFPGLGKDEATFDILWGARSPVMLATIPCPAPDRPAQALIWALNHARNERSDAPATRVRDLRDSDLGTAVIQLVDRMDAQVGWAAALGELDRVSDRREHDLWLAVVRPTSRVAEWRARLKAEPTLAGRVLITLRAPLVNVEHLTNTRGRAPTKIQIGREFIHRARRAALEIWRSCRGRAS